MLEIVYMYDDKKLACLGGVAQQFLDQGFKIRGIEGAVFPTVPPPTIVEGEAVRDGLYQNAINVNAVSGLLS